MAAARSSRAHGSRGCVRRLPRADTAAGGVLLRARCCLVSVPGPRAIESTCMRCPPARALHTGNGGHGAVRPSQRTYVPYRARRSTTLPPTPPAVWERIRARARRGDRSIDQPATADFSFRIASSSFSFFPPPAPALLPRPRHGSPSRTTRNVTATSSLLYVALAIGRPPVRAGGFERTRRRRK